MFSSISYSAVGTERNVGIERSSFERSIAGESNSDDGCGGGGVGGPRCNDRFRDYTQLSGGQDCDDNYSMSAYDSKRRRVGGAVVVVTTATANEAAGFETESDYNNKDDGDSDDDDNSDDGNNVPSEVNVCRSAESENNVAMEKYDDDNDSIEASSEDESGDDCSQDGGDDSESEDDYSSTDEYDYCSDEEEEESSSASVALMKMNKTPPKFSFVVPPPHELFLPNDTSPTFEHLNYKSDDGDGDGDDDDDGSSDNDSSDDDSSDDEDDEQETHSMTPSYASAQMYMTVGRGRRLGQQWQGHERNNHRSSRCSLQNPPSSSFSLVTDSSSLGSDPSCPSSSDSNHAKATKRAGVSFSGEVTVFPIFKKSVYSPTMKTNIYTPSSDLRKNRLRNKKEYQYEKHDWKRAVEEEGMKLDPETGELVHPAHHANSCVVPSKKRGAALRSKRRSRAIPDITSTNDAILSSYEIGSMVVTRAKRMRIWH